MRFNSLDYIIFLGLAIAGFWVLANNKRARMVFIFIASCLFYMAWDYRYIVLILGSTLVDYFAGGKIAASEDDKVRKKWLYLSLCSNLGLLGLFKYYNFVIGMPFDLGGFLSAQGIDWLTSLGNAPPKWLNFDLLLPVGISFYTFQTLSYTIDIYRRKLEPATNLLEFAFFVTYFPQLVAGPIVRASEMLPQLKADTPKLTQTRVSRGLFLIATGLVKKIAIADYLSVNLVDRVFDNPELYTATEVVVGLYGFTMQMYCDFSGYTDVARGSAMLMGIDLPRNFDRPYQATNPAAFWRRWHMTLSTWLRDYLYFPLGGSRVGPIRAYWNLWLTMFLIGIWHGASWNFVVYGSLQAFAMVIHRYLHRRAQQKRIANGGPKQLVDSTGMTIFKIFWCMQFVVFSRILFRAKNWDNAMDVTSRLFSGTTSTAQIPAAIWMLLLVTFAVHYSPKKIFESFEQNFIKLPAPAQGIALAITLAILSLVATSEVVPYIYYQF